MARACPIETRTYMGWETYHRSTSNGIYWIARQDGGRKLRAPTLGALRTLIAQTEGRHA